MCTVKDGIWQALKTVPYPGYNRDIVSFGLVLGVAEYDGVATVTLDAEHLAPEMQQKLADSIGQALRSLQGLRSVSIEAAKPQRAPSRSEREAPRPASLPGIRHVLAVGSGKGGVGKSTVTVNLAVALAQRGLRVGLLDADAYGPNVPRMMGVAELPPFQAGKIQPAEAMGVRMISVGLMVDRETPLVWRGPMTDKMVRQFVADVEWAELDVLLADLPPGTGDIPVSLAQHVLLDGALVVVTPQAVAADDALKAIGMFRRLQVPVLGVVENMSYFVCDGCDKCHRLFGSGGGRRLAAAAGIPFLGEVPFEPAVGVGGDVGEPAVLRPASPAGVALREIAGRVWLGLESSAGIVTI